VHRGDGTAEPELRDGTSLWVVLGLAAGASVLFFCVGMRFECLRDMMRGRGRVAEEPAAPAQANGGFAGGEARRIQDRAAADDATLRMLALEGRGAAGRGQPAPPPVVRPAAAAPKPAPLSARKPGGAQGADEDDCVVCMDAAADMLLVPCGHVCLCAGCADSMLRLDDAGRRCPLCRTALEGAVRRQGKAAEPAAEP